jgi:hypothetical protein
MKGYTMTDWDGKLADGRQAISVPQTADNRVQELEKQVKDLTESIAYLDNQKVEAVQEIRAKFVRDVLEYHEGCTSGKIDFLNECGLDIPTVTATVSFKVKDIPWGGEDDIRNEIEYALYDHLANRISGTLSTIDIEVEGV